MTDDHGTRRVAIVGVGLKSPAGSTVEQAWSQLITGASFAREIDQFNPESLPVRFACSVVDFAPEEYFGKADRRRLDRVVHLGVAAAVDAMTQAGDVDALPERCAVVVGTGVGGLSTMVAQAANVLESKESLIPPYSLPSLMPNATAAVVSIRFGMTGPSRTCSGACASGGQAIADAVRLIRWDVADFVVAGGSEAPITRLLIHAFHRMGALSQRNSEPCRASRPFDIQRDGFVLGEGAGMLALERWDFAVRRNATILGEVIGVGESSDAHHLAIPPDDGRGGAAAMSSALADAGISPDAITHINAHGSSTFANDLGESRAIERIFSRSSPPVVSIKGAIGHLLGAAGAVELIVSLEAMRRNLLPPTANFARPGDGISIDVVSGEPRPLADGPVLSNSFAFGGHNVSLIIDRAH